MATTTDEGHTVTKLVLHNIGELITMAPLSQRKGLAAIKEQDLGRIKKGWLAIEGGKVVASGEGKTPPPFHDWPQHDVKEGLVLPGFVDCHTHPIFAGSRAHEFSAKLRGATYQEIAAQGGGIKFTVNATRRASDEELRHKTEAVLDEFLRCGVTTVEMKSGYGLSVQEELRHLRILNEVAQTGRQTTSITCLALHAVPAEASSTAQFIETMTKELLPLVHKEKLAVSVDAFVENGYFSVEECEAYFAAAKELGFTVRIHADEFTDSGAAAAAARWGARSADHLECAPASALQAMAQSQTVGVILPGTSLYSRLPFTKAKPFLDHQTPLAIATDYNPGSCCLKNLPFIAAMAAVQCQIDLPHTLAAITYVAAYALELEAQKGALAPGHDADLVIYELKSAEEWLADFGQLKPQRVMIKGEFC
jgi:imidazolonepropionase